MIAPHQVRQIHGPVKLTPFNTPLRQARGDPSQMAPYDRGPVEELSEAIALWRTPRDTVVYRGSPTRKRCCRRAQLTATSCGITASDQPPGMPASPRTSP